MRSLLTAAILLFASLSWGSSAVITTSSIPAGAALLPYSASISAAEGECERYEWTITPLPSGLIAIVQTSSIAISGTPSIAGHYSFTVSVKGCDGHIVSKTYALTIVRDDGSRTSDHLLPEVR